MAHWFRAIVPGNKGPYLPTTVVLAAVPVSIPSTHKLELSLA